MSESNNSSHPKAPRFSSTKIGAVLRITLIFVVYVLGFIVLDLSAHAVQVFPGIVAWYPPDGLSFAFLLIFGVGFLPAVAIASIISSFFVFQLSLSFSTLFGWAIFISLIYGFTAWFLRQKVRLDTQLHSMRDVLWLIASAVIVSTILAVISVSAATASGVVPQAERVWATVQWWIGEMIGVLVLTPALLIHVMPYVKRFADGEALFQKSPISFKRPTFRVILQAVTILAAIYLAVEVNLPNDFHPYFLIGIPLIWIALQHGLPGASLGIMLANFGMIWTVQGNQHFELVELGQLQSMMLVITMASLIIGAIVSDNRRTAQSSAPEIERRRRMIAYEWIIVSVLAMSAWVLENSYSIFQRISEWEARNQVEGINEILATILVLGMASAVFSLRRWREFQVELRKREKAQAELHTLYSDLESKVQERTADLSKANELLRAEITERGKAEEALLQNERRFRALIEHSMEEVSLVSTDGTLIFESPTMRQPLGYPPGSFVGRNLFDLFHPDDQPAAIKLLEQVSEQPGSFREASFRLRHQNGSWRWMEGTVTNLLDDPAVGAIVINYRDVTGRKLAEEETQTRAHELLMLYELSRALATANDLDTILDLLNRQTVESVHASFARIALLEDGELAIRSAYPIRVLEHNLAIGSRKPITAMPYSQSVLGQDEPMILRSSNLEVSGEERADLLLDFAQTLCLIPLRVHDFTSHSSRILGLLMVGEVRKEERESFTPEKIRLARSIGDQAAITIDNTRLFNDLERSNVELSHAYDATITGWSAALDLRDKETEGHTQRVAETTLRLAKRMGFSEQDLVQVRRGALLHDIGKMGVPDSILLKPDKLTDEEWVIMRMHPSHAFQMLKPITYLRLALDIPYCHHEKWDGTGYPRRLKGEQIPFAARIFAIVDVYDALTSDRPYRKSWSREKTLEHIRELSGNHFDPRVVDAFLELMEAGT